MRSILLLNSILERCLVSGLYYAQLATLLVFFAERFAVSDHKFGFSPGGIPQNGDSFLLILLKLRFFFILNNEHLIQVSDRLPAVRVLFPIPLVAFIFAGFLCAFVLVPSELLRFFDCVRFIFFLLAAF